jgi:hypothetical protein
MAHRTFPLVLPPRLVHFVQLLLTDDRATSEAGLLARVTIKSYTSLLVLKVVCGLSVADTLSNRNRFFAQTPDKNLQ